MTESLLYRARKAAGMTQQAAAERWSSLWPEEPKVAKVISAWETGLSAPSVASLRRLATVYGCRAGDLLDEPATSVAPAPAVSALAVVAHAGAVLLVQRADSMRWQFPAGHVAPERSGERVAVRECRAETGISVIVREFLGERIHPVSKVLCRYYACDYLAGDVVNGDVEENSDVLWAPLERLDDFIPSGLFGPAADYLRGARV